jgi:DNA-binding MarR family transcriptional regulator
MSQDDILDRGRQSAMKQSDYEALAEFRYQIRSFLNLSEQAARRAGLEPQQHQLILALKGLPKGAPATVGRLAARLELRHHSAVELIDRLAAHGLVRRHRSENDRRAVRVAITPRGERVLRRLSLHHQSLLRTAGPRLIRALRQVMGGRPRRRARRRYRAGPRPGGHAKLSARTIFTPAAKRS